jgi:SAM-dependent methyltransferase
MFARKIKNILNELSLKYSFFLFLRKFFLKSTKKDNNKLRLYSGFIIMLFIEIFSEILSIFKFSKLEQSFNTLEEENLSQLRKIYNGSRATSALQLIMIIFFLKTNKETNNILKTSELLDIGCGYGKALFYFKKIFSKVHGVEVNKDLFYDLNKNFSKNNTKVNFINSDFFNMKIPENVNFFYMFSPFRDFSLYENLINILIKFSQEQNKRIYFIVVRNSHSKKMFDLL